MNIIMNIDDILFHRSGYSMDITILHDITGLISIFIAFLIYCLCAVHAKLSWTGMNHIEWSCVCLLILSTKVGFPAVLKPVFGTENCLDSKSREGYGRLKWKPHKWWFRRIWSSLVFTSANILCHAFTVVSLGNAQTVWLLTTFVGCHWWTLCSVKMWIVKTSDPTYCLHIMLHLRSGAASLGVKKVTNPMEMGRCPSRSNGWRYTVESWGNSCEMGIFLLRNGLVSSECWKQNWQSVCLISEKEHRSTMP